MPYISQSFIDDLPNQIDIIDLINRRLPLKKMGSDYRAPCPFHGGKNRNFAVSSQKQFYHCFKCGESGGAIKFMQQFENLSFVEAIETIAGEFGLNIVYDKKSKPKDSRVQRYLDLLQKVSAFYIQQLKTATDKQKAVDYAKKRGISGEIAKRFDIGFATVNGGLEAHFKNSKQNINDLKDLGLIKIGERNSYDFFRDRLMFPIHNSRGSVIAFGGRAFDANAKAKYLNSSESLIFSKSKELYGLYHARKYSRSMDYILVVEGYMDVVALHQAGISRTVAALGTAITAQHLQLLARTSNRIIFCFDGDSAGRSAAWKSLKITLPLLKTGLMIKFLFLPEGEDPDSLVKKESAKAFEGRIDKAHTLSKFLFEHIKSGVDFNTIEGKTQFLESCADLLSQINYETYQQQLIEGIADEVGQSVEQVKLIVSRVKSTQSAPDFADIPMNEAAFMPDFSPKKPKSKSHQTSKVLMSRMISLLLNYPIIADATVETRIKNIEKYDVLLELVHSAQIDGEISQTDLIKPFKGKPAIYNRLQQLCILEPHLSETQAKDEFLSALNTTEKHQENAKIKASITGAKTTEAQQKIMQDIKKNKTKT